MMPHYDGNLSHSDYYSEQLYSNNLFIVQAVFGNKQ